MSGQVRRHDEGSIRHLVLTNPGRQNAVDLTMLDRLESEIKDIGETPIAVIRGENGSFCAGADLVATSDVLKDAARLRPWLQQWRRVTDALEASPTLVIAAIDGVAVAGGLELALACDLIVATPTSRLGDGHLRHGLVPGARGAERLTARIGGPAARRLMIDGGLIPADEAARIGLVDVVTNDATDGQLEALLRRVAGLDPSALAWALGRTRDPDGDDLDGAVRLITAPAGQDGIGRFVGRTPPR